jgi:hypothetical protein
MSGPNDRSVKIQFPENIIEIIDEWASSIERGVGVCLLCGNVIHSDADFIPARPLTIVLPDGRLSSENLALDPKPYLTFLLAVAGLWRY